MPKRKTAKKKPVSKSWVNNVKHPGVFYKELSFWYKLTAILVGVFILTFTLLLVLPQEQEKADFNKIEKDVNLLASNITINGSSPVTTKGCRQAQEKFGGGYWWCSVGFNSPQLKTLDEYDTYLAKTRVALNSQGVFGTETIIESQRNNVKAYFKNSYGANENGRSCGITARFDNTSGQNVISFGCQMKVQKPLF